MATNTLEWLARVQHEHCTNAEHYNIRETENEGRDIMYRNWAIEEATMAEIVGRVYDCLVRLEI